MAENVDEPTISDDDSIGENQATEETNSEVDNVIRNGEDNGNEYAGIGTKINVFIEVKKEGEAINDVLVGSIDFEIISNSRNFTRLDDLVTQLVEGHPLLPAETDIFYQTSIAHSRRGYCDMPTDFSHLVENLSRILVGAPRDDVY